jgi:hypothetical protein
LIPSGNTLKPTLIPENTIRRSITAGIIHHDPLKRTDERTKFQIFSGKKTVLIFFL